MCCNRRCKRNAALPSMPLPISQHLRTLQIDGFELTVETPSPLVQQYSRTSVAAQKQGDLPAAPANSVVLAQLPANVIHTASRMREIENGAGITHQQGGPARFRPMALGLSRRSSGKELVTMALLTLHTIPKGHEFAYH